MSSPRPLYDDYREERRPWWQSRPLDVVAKVGDVTKVNQMVKAMTGDELSRERAQRQAESWLLREQLYALSSVVGRLQMDGQLDDLERLLHSWSDTEAEGGAHGP